MRPLVIAVSAFMFMSIAGTAGWAQDAAAPEPQEQPIYLQAKAERPPDAQHTDEASSASAPVAPPSPTPTAGAPEVHIIINIPATTLTLYENGEAKMHAKVAVGQGIYPTPEDKMTIDHVEWNPWWLPPPSDWAKDAVKTPPGPGNPLGVVKMPMQRAVMLHGTNSQSSVGRAASHGCMRMYNKDAGDLAWYLQTHFSDKTDPKLRDVYAKNRRTTYYVKLNQNVPVDIIYDPVAVANGELNFFPDYYGKVRSRKEEAIITAITASGVNRKDIKEDRVEIYAQRWPTLETRIPLHRVVTTPEAEEILKLPPVDEHVRLTE